MAVQGQDETWRLTTGMGLVGWWLCPQVGKAATLSFCPCPVPDGFCIPGAAIPAHNRGSSGVPEQGTVSLLGGQAHPHCPASSLLHPAAFGALRDAPHGLATGRYRQPSDGAGSHQTVPGAAHLPSPQSARGAVQLRGRASELEAELAEQRHLKQQAQDESEFLRAELEELKKQREDTEKAQRSLTEIESERGEPAPSLGWG